MTDECTPVMTRPSVYQTSNTQTEGSSSLPDLELSVIVTVDSDYIDEDLMTRYRAALDAMDRRYEFLCVFDAGMAQTKATVDGLAKTWPELEAIVLRPWSGEDAAMAFCVRRSRGRLILTLPSWLEVDPSELGGLVDSLGSDDMVVGARATHVGSRWQRFRKNMMHRLIRLLFGHNFGDVFSRVRVGRTEMFQEISDYGVRQHFLPLLAVSNGYKVSDVPTKEVAASSGESSRYHFKPLAHIGALLDVLSLFVVLKFLKRPLRFFGSIGLLFAGVGAAFTGWLVFARLFLDQPLADRPALIFSVMMVVLGVQIIALGLIGEIVIFSSSRRSKLYSIEKIVGGDSKGNVED